MGYYVGLLVGGVGMLLVSTDNQQFMPIWLIVALAFNIFGRIITEGE